MGPRNTSRKIAGVKRSAGTAPKGKTEGLQGCVIGSKEGLTGGRRGRRFSEGSEDIVSESDTN